jgi:hypothetical protein
MEIFLSHQEELSVIFSKVERFALIPGVPFVDGTLPLQPGEERRLYVFAKDGKWI